MSDTKGVPGEGFSAHIVWHDIRHARRMESRACVISRLLKRVVPDAQEVHVQHGHIALRYKRDNGWYFWTHDASDLITAFDERGADYSWVGKRVRFTPIRGEGCG